ncbi:MAG: DUF401 family protein [Desulfomonile tiedjei]|nr:DUF401 family protein [Desulfomonile tiedjei]
MMLFALPALIKILLTFVVILILSRFVPLYAGLFAGSLIVGLWMGMEPLRVLLTILQEVSSGACLWLALVVSLIIALSELLAKSGQLERIVATFQAISPGSRFTLIAMPALIGLLPMPGGALFSAPMVATAAGDARIAPELKVVVNYWFRHIWEPWWPLYPGVILAVSLFGLPTWEWILIQWPLTLGAICGGVLFILPHLPRFPDTKTKASWPAVRRFLSEVRPIIMLVVLLFGIQGLVTALGEFVPALRNRPLHMSFAPALAITIGAVMLQNSLRFGDLRRACFNRGVTSMMMIVFGIMAFKGCLIESHAISQVRSELDAAHVAPWAVAALLPFMAALVTGIAVAFVGTALPLVVSLIPEGHSPIALATLAYGCGFLGMMLSPIHLCLLVSSEYFCAQPLAGYRLMWKPAILCLAWTFAVFAAYRLAFG